MLLQDKLELRKELDEIKTEIEDLKERQRKVTKLDVFCFVVMVAFIAVSIIGWVM